MKQRERVESMLKTKAAIGAGSILGAFIIIYGTAAVFGLLFGTYLFEGGLANLTYALLALLCAIPFVLAVLLGRNNGETRGAVVISALLFSVLFVLVHLVLIVSAEVMDTAAVTRILVVFPVSALLLAGTLYFTAERKKAV